MEDGIIGSGHCPAKIDLLRVAGLSWSGELHRMAKEVIN